MWQSLFFPTENYSSAYMIVANCGLWKLLKNLEEHEFYQQDDEQAEYTNARSICEQNLEKAAAALPLLLEHSYIQIQALSLLVDTFTSTP